MYRITHINLICTLLFGTGLLLSANASADTLAQQRAASYGRNNTYNAEYLTRYLREQRTEQVQPPGDSYDPSTGRLARPPQRLEQRRRFGNENAFWNSNPSPRVNSQYEQGFKERYQRMMQGQAPQDNDNAAYAPPPEE